MWMFQDVSITLEELELADKHLNIIEMFLDYNTSLPKPRSMAIKPFSTLFLHKIVMHEQ